MANNMEVQLLSELRNTLETRYRGVNDPFRENADDLLELIEIRLYDIERRTKKRYPTEAEYLKMRRGSRVASCVLHAVERDWPDLLAGFNVMTDIPANRMQYVFHVVYNVLMSLSYGVAGYEADREEDEPGFIERCNKERREYVERTSD